MTKTDLVKHLASTYPDLFLRDIVRIVDTVFDEMASALARGQRVELRGFGSFDMRRRSARMGRNPRTGVDVKVPAKIALHFKAGKDLHDRLNSASAEPASAGSGPIVSAVQQR